MHAPWCITGCPPTSFIKPHAKYKHGGQPRVCFVGISWRHVRQGSMESKRKHQVEGAIMQAKEWTRTFGRCTRSRSNKCTREEPSQEKERGKSPIQLFVRVL
jgi:hypothetical protein